MRRFFIVPKSVWLMAHHASLFHPGVGSHFIDLVAPGESPTPMAEIAPAKVAVARAAFSAEAGAGSNYVLVSTDFHSEGVEELWHGHDAVAILPHPTFEGNDPIHQHVGSATKRIHPAHIAALASHAGIGYVHGDTVLDLARKAAAVHPLMKLRHIL
jgi:hypothetical protein